MTSPGCCAPTFPINSGRFIFFAKFEKVFCHLKSGGVRPKLKFDAFFLSVVWSTFFDSFACFCCYFFIFSLFPNFFKNPLVFRKQKLVCSRHCKIKMVFVVHICHLGVFFQEKKHLKSESSWSSRKPSRNGWAHHTGGFLTRFRSLRSIFLRFFLELYVCSKQ